METTKESFTKKGRRPKSATRYPKRMPTYVVAFAVQETHDDPANLPIPNKRSLENSSSCAKSISPAESTNSAKTFTITPTETLSHVLNIPTISEVKIDIIDDNQCGDIEKKSPQISSYIVVDNSMADEQPEIIFNASKHIKKYKDNNKFLRKKPKKNKRVIKFKNIHFKYKNPKSSISRRLEKYYEKTKMNSPNSEEIQKQICSNGLSKVVCKSRDLKKVLAKANLLDDSDRISLYDGFCANEYDDGTPNSSPSTTKKSFISYASQNTLIRKSSSSSRNEDFYSMKTVNSVIQVSSEVLPYKSEVINVAVAVAFNTSKPSNDPTDSRNNSNEIFMHTENLTSEETFLFPSIDLTSGTPSHDNAKINYCQITPLTLNEKDLSSDTLTGYDKKSVVGVCSEDDTFVIARTSSDFNKSSIDSEFTLTSNSDTLICSESFHPNLLSKEDFTYDDFSNRTTLSETVKTLGFYPGMAPSTSYDASYDNAMNDVIVTENMITSFPINTKNIGDLPIEVKNNLSKSVLKKSFDVEKLAWLQRNIQLPNDIAIKAELKEADQVQRKTCSEGLRNNYPKDFSEMWERLTLALDLAVRRLEETLAEKIMKELKKSLEIFNQPECRAPKLEIEGTEIPQIEHKHTEVKMSHKEVSVIEDYLKADIDECLQCDLVQNQVIDQLMLKLSVEGPKPLSTSTVSLKKLKKPEIVKDYFEILKPPVVESALVEVGRGDTITVSTATAEFRSEEFHGLQRIKLLFSGPMTFLRENVFVITSVPTFFIVLLCLYGIIVIIIKPW